jgi:hypothetical protein
MESLTTLPHGCDLTWEDFEDRLTAVLGRMAARSYLILSTPPDGEHSYYVQFAQGGRGGFRAEAESNNFLAGRWALSPAQEEQLAQLGWQCPTPGDSDLNFMRQWPVPAPYADIARLAVRSLREVYGIAQPADLVYRRFAKGAHDFAEPELGIEPERPTTQRGRRLTPAAAELASFVEEAARSLLNGDEIVRDKDGDVLISIGHALMFVRIIDGTPPVVRVFSPMRPGIEASRSLLETLNEVNSNLLFGKALWAAGRVIVSAEVPAVRITAEQIAFACLQIGALAGDLDHQLGERFGSEKMLDGPKGPVN